MTTLVARSNDGSLIGIHPHEAASSTSKTGMIRCYDGNVSNGSLKFTLRFPLSTNDDDKNDELRKLVFASNNDNSSPNYLCGMRQSSSSFLIWDLDRGVLSATIDVRNANNSASKKKRKSVVASGNEILCDVATAGNQLYALVFLPDESSGSSVGKCRLYQYDLSAGDDAKVVKKIKLGSVPAPSSNKEEEGVAGSNFAMAISKSTIVVRMGSLLRVFDLTTGEKLGKVDIPHGVSSSDDEESDNTPLSVTPDGRYIVTSTNNQAILFSYNKEDGDDGMQTMALLSSKDDSTISYLDLTQSDEELALVTFQPTARIASLFTISTKTNASLVPQMPQAQLQTNENKPSFSLIHAGFHPRKPHESVLLLFQQAKHAGGSAAGSGTSLPMESLSYADKDSLEGTVTVGTSLSGDDASDKKKRKAASNVALAPGDQGQEASLAMDLTQKKKARVDQDEDAEAADDDEFQDMEEDGEQGQSIAERLALLSSAMEQTDEEDDEDEDQESSVDVKKFKLKSATSQTLTTLLTQALSSNDSVQLNTALQVTDRRLVEGTVRALQALDAERGSKEADDSEATTTGYIPTLLAHIVRRMARRHSLVMPLGVWVKAILAATARSSTNQVLHTGDNAVEEQMAREGREMAMKLGPLKNFLNERVECFPQLLRLEGRLALLNQQL